MSVDERLMSSTHWVPSPIQPSHRISNKLYEIDPRIHNASISIPGIQIGRRLLILVWGVSWVITLLEMR